MNISIYQFDIGWADSGREPFDIEWEDSGREPECPPDPRYPRGKPITAPLGTQRVCFVSLPYPARRCGAYRIRCRRCGLLAVVTTAGRPDDPCSIELPCLRLGVGPDEKKLV